MLVILPSPIPELQHTPLPLQSAANQGTREHAPTPYSFFVLSLDSHLSPLRSLGVHHKSITFCKINISTHFLAFLPSKLVS
jgi:hypothetical protein